MKRKNILRWTLVSCIMIISLIVLPLLSNFVIQDAEYIQFSDSLEGTRILFIGNSYT